MCLLSLALPSLEGWREAWPWGPGLVLQDQPPPALGLRLSSRAPVGPDQPALHRMAAQSLTSGQSQVRPGRRLTAGMAPRCSSRGSPAPPRPSTLGTAGTVGEESSAEADRRGHGQAPLERKGKVQGASGDSSVPPGQGAGPQPRRGPGGPAAPLSVPPLLPHPCLAHSSGCRAWGTALALSLPLLSFD